MGQRKRPSPKWSGSSAQMRHPRMHPTGSFGVGHACTEHAKHVGSEESSYLCRQSVQQHVFDRNRCCPDPPAYCGGEVLSPCGKDVWNNQQRRSPNSYRALLGSRRWTTTEATRAHKAFSFKGVSPYHRDERRWRAYGDEDGRRIYSGLFGFEVDAAIAVNYHDAYHGKPIRNAIPADEMHHD